MKIVDGSARLFELLRHSSRSNVDGQVVTCTPGGWTERSSWLQLERRARRFAAACARRGVGEGDVVAILATNTHRVLETTHAIAGLGAALLPLAPHHDAQQLLHAAINASPRLIFVESGFAHRVRVLQHLLPWLQPIVMSARSVTTGLLLQGAIGYETLIGAEKEDGRDWTCVHEDATCVLAYGVGRFGELKRHAYSHRGAVLEALIAGRAEVPAGAPQTVLAAIPMSHSARPWGLALPLGAGNARLVLPGPCLSPTAIIRLIALHGVTTLSALPGLCHALLSRFDEGTPVPATLKHISSGGLPLPEHVVERYAQRHGIDVLLRATPLQPPRPAGGRTWISGVTLESFAAQHPEITEAAVVDFGAAGQVSRRMLVVVRRPNGRLTAAQLREFLIPRLAPHLRPDLIEMSDTALPRLDNDLVDKGCLHDLYLRRALGHREQN